MAAATGERSAPVMASCIEHWPVDRLTPYRQNPRTHSAEQLAQLKRSISEFGFTNPILVDGDGVVIAGHGRLMAAIDMGMTVVPVVVLGHLTPQQRRAYVIADNQLALNAGWDMGVLQEEAASLGLADFDLDLLGFDAATLDKILHHETEDDEGEVDEEEDEPPERDGVPLAIVLSPGEMAQWREAKAELGYSKDKTAFLKLVTDLLEEVKK